MDKGRDKILREAGCALRERGVRCPWFLRTSSWQARCWRWLHVPRGGCGRARSCARPRVGAVVCGGRVRKRMTGRRLIGVGCGCAVSVCVCFKAAPCSHTGKQPHVATRRAGETMRGAGAGRHGCARSGPAARSHAASARVTPAQKKRCVSVRLCCRGRTAPSLAHWKHGGRAASVDAARRRAAAAPTRNMADGMLVGAMQGKVRRCEGLLMEKSCVTQVSKSMENHPVQVYLDLQGTSRSSLYLVKTWRNFWELCCPVSNLGRGRRPDSTARPHGTQLQWHACRGVVPGSLTIARARAPYRPALHASVGSHPQLRS